jgi:hypothetical protein
MPFMRVLIQLSLLARNKFYASLDRNNILVMKSARLILDFIWLSRFFRPRKCEIWFLYSTSHVRLCSSYIKQFPSRKIFPLYFGERIQKSLINRELPQAQYLSLYSFSKTVLYLCISPINKVQIRVPYISEFNLGSFAKVMNTVNPSPAVAYFDDGPVTFLKKTLVRRLLLPKVIHDFACWSHPHDRSDALIKRQVSLQYYTEFAAHATVAYPCLDPNEFCHLIFWNLSI